MAGVNITYVNTTTFTTIGDVTTTFNEGRRVRVTATSGYLYGTISSSSYSSPNTTVILTAASDNLDSSISVVYYGIAADDIGSLPIHSHDEENEGGIFPLINLSDTPGSYDTGKYLKSTTSGTEWATGAGGTTVHSELTNLAYADSGHTGFAPTSHSHTESDISDLDKYTEAEVNTISGTLSSEIDSDISTHTSNSDAHHNESHTIASHSDTTGTGAQLNELVGSGNTILHKHDTLYYTETEIDTISGTLQTDIDTKLENIIEDITPELGGDLSCGNYNLDNVGKICSFNLATTIYNDNGFTLTKGTAITICGLHNEVCTVCITDNRETTKMPCCGIVDTDIAASAEGCGIRLGRINMDTSGMTGNEGDRLYVQADGSLDTIIPTSGMMQRVGFLVVKASGNAGRICVCIRGPRSMYSAKDQHPIIRMGDDVGHQKVVFKDYTDNEIGAIDDNGNLTISGTIDGVDIATFKSDFDIHDHDDRYYTESEVDNLITTVSGKLDDHNEMNNLDYVSSGHTGFQPSGDYATDAELTSTSGILQTDIDTRATSGGAEHDNFSDFVANEHIDHSGVSITAGTGLTGGGDITLTRTLDVDVGITDDKIVQIDDLDAADNDYCKLTASGIEGRSVVEVRSDLKVENTKNVVVKVIADDTALTTGDGKAYFTVPIELNGMNLVSVGAHVYTVSSSGLPSFQIYNLTDIVGMLSTAITIDATEKDSSTATTPAVINEAADDVATGDELRFDCDVAGTGAKGMEIRMGFRLP